MSLLKSIDELMPFLSPTAKDDLRRLAVDQVLGLSASDDGMALLNQHQTVLSALFKLRSDPLIAVKKTVYQSVVNLSVDEDLALRVSSFEGGRLLISLFEACAQSTDDDITQAACMALSNLTRTPQCCNLVWQTLLNSKSNLLENLITLTCQDKACLHHTGLLLCNLSQLKDVRSEEVNILPNLVLPLAGPEVLDDDENDKLPIELQYLAEDKTREEDPEIRQMLIEAITQLCATKKGRLFIKDSGIYYILRELHKWEKPGMVKIACENLVDILIGDEPQPGMDNLKQVEIPSDLEEKFKKMDEDDLLNANDELN